MLPTDLTRALEGMLTNKRLLHFFDDLKRIAEALETIAAVLKEYHVEATHGDQ